MVYGVVVTAHDDAEARRSAARILTLVGLGDVGDADDAVATAAPVADSNADTPHASEARGA